MIYFKSYVAPIMGKNLNHNFFTEFGNIVCFEILVPTRLESIAKKRTTTLFLTSAVSKICFVCYKM
jgi:hypothetical protein